MYYTRRVAFIAIGIIFLVICPLMLCIVCGVYRYRQKQLKEDPQWQMPMLPRSRASSARNLRTLNYDDDSDTDASTLKKSRSYDKVYRTNEPLPGKPQIDFPAKKWDLDENDEDVTSSEGSENRNSPKLAKDISYINPNVTHQTGEKPKQSGRRSLRSPSGTELDQQGEHDDPNHHPDEDDDFDEADVHGGTIHPAGYHQPMSPEEADQLHRQQYSPTFSGLDSRTSGASSINYNPAVQNRFGGVPVLPSNTQYFSGTPQGVATATPLRTAPTPLTQDSGLPSPPLATSPTPSVQKSTEV